MLGKKPKDFQSDVIDKTGTILAERNAKEDKEMADAKVKAEEGVRNAEKLMTDVADRLVRATAVVDKKQMEFDITRTKLTKAREAVSKAEAPTASASENQDIETKRSTLVAAEADFSKATTELKDAQYDIGAIQRDLAQAREKLGQKQQELAALTMPKLPDGVAAAMIRATKNNKIKLFNPKSLCKHTPFQTFLFGINRLVFQEKPGNTKLAGNLRR